MNINFLDNDSINNPFDNATGYVYGQEVFNTPFAMELVGYFQAPQDGTYKFFSITDNGTSLRIGNWWIYCPGAIASIKKTIFNIIHLKVAMVLLVQKLT